jgi:hypothetical protein
VQITALSALAQITSAMLTVITHQWNRDKQCQTLE